MMMRGGLSLLSLLSLHSLVNADCGTDSCKTEAEVIVPSGLQFFAATWHEGERGLGVP